MTIYLQNHGAGLYTVQNLRQEHEPRWAGSSADLGRRLVTQGVHKLPDLVPLPISLLRGFFDAFFVSLHFFLRLVAFARLTVCLRKTIVRLFHVRINLDGTLIVRN